MRKVQQDICKQEKPKESFERRACLLERISKLLKPQLQMPVLVSLFLSGLHADRKKGTGPVPSFSCIVSTEIFIDTRK